MIDYVILKEYWLLLSVLCFDRYIRITPIEHKDKEGRLKNSVQGKQTAHYLTLP